MKLLFVGLYLHTRHKVKSVTNSHVSLNVKHWEKNSKLLVFKGKGLPLNCFTMESHIVSLIWVITTRNVSYEIENENEFKNV